MCEMRKDTSGGLKCRQKSGHFRPCMSCKDFGFYPKVNVVLLEGFKQRPGVLFKNINLTSM